MYPEFIYIYDGASVNAESMILTHFNPFETWKNVFAAEVKPVVIGENAIVAVRCTIMPGVTIGKYAVVSSGITVEKDVPEYTICSLKHEIKQVNIRSLMK
jgi:acetyltransferase-like isoleucine patch superfamily enzyme